MLLGHIKHNPYTPRDQPHRGTQVEHRCLQSSLSLAWRQVLAPRIVKAPVAMGEFQGPLWPKAQKLIGARCLPSNGELDFWINLLVPQSCYKSIRFWKRSFQSCPTPLLCFNTWSFTGNSVWMSHVNKFNVWLVVSTPSRLILLKLTSVLSNLLDVTSFIFITLLQKCFLSFRSPANSVLTFSRPVTLYNSMLLQWQ